MTTSFDTNLFPASHFLCLETGGSHLGLNPVNTDGALTIRTLICAVSPLQQHKCARVYCLDKRAFSSLPSWAKDDA